MAGSSITTALGDLGGLGSAGLAWLETRMVGLLAEGSIWTTGMPAAKSNHAGPIDSDYAFITIICTIFFVPITIALVYFAFRYKKAPGEKAESDVSHNTPLEVTWTVIPMLIVVVMFYIGFRDVEHSHHPLALAGSAIPGLLALLQLALREDQRAHHCQPECLPPNLAESLWERPRQLEQSRPRDAVDLEVGHSPRRHVAEVLARQDHVLSPIPT